ARINADATLIAAGALVNVAFNATDGRYEITSRQYGSNSVVTLSGTDPNSEASLGLVLSDGEAGRGRDAEGLINGVPATGAGQFLSLPTGPQPASPGFINGAATTAFQAPPLTLDANNSSFTIAVNGTTSALINLTQGDYANGSALAAEMESQINADTTLSGLGQPCESASTPVAVVSSSRRNGWGRLECESH
ncbi:MAG: hypothetical protein HC809_08860, partial [Gammaproteobacteria bacterium]|nr:hypothetical protein [Gammaproteobacteria bacterium]